MRSSRGEITPSESPDSRSRSRSRSPENVDLRRKTYDEDLARSRVEIFERKSKELDEKIQELREKAEKIQEFNTSEIKINFIRSRMDTWASDEHGREFFALEVSHYGIFRGLYNKKVDKYRGQKALLQSELDTHIHKIEMHNQELKLKSEKYYTEKWYDTFKAAEYPYETELAPLPPEWPPLPSEFFS